MSPVALTDLVVDRANALGFDLVGVTAAGPAPDFERYQRWLAGGHHGEMAYLARRDAERADVRVWYPAARSLILVGVSYFREMLPAALRNDPARGQIAAYAWSDDYHEVIKPLLFQLDAAIRTATGRTTHGKVFVDTRSGAGAQLGAGCRTGLHRQEHLPDFARARLVAVSGRAGRAGETG